MITELSSHVKYVAALYGSAKPSEPGGDETIPETVPEIFAAGGVGLAFTGTWIAAPLIVLASILWLVDQAH